MDKIYSGIYNNDDKTPKPSDKDGKPKKESKLILK